MNIWVFNQYASSPNHSTGAGERYYYVSKKLKDKDVNMTIFSASFNHLFVQQPVAKGRFTKEGIDGVDFRWVRTMKYQGGSSSWQRVLSMFHFALNLFFIRKNKETTPDVIVVSSMSMFPIFAALFYRRRYKNCKIVFEIRDIWPLTIMELAGASKFHPFVKLLSYTEKLAYRKSDHLVSVLPKADDHIKNTISTDFSFDWIPNGVDTADILSNVHDSEIEFPEGAFVIGYCGALGRTYSLELLIDVVLELSSQIPVYAFILGEGDLKEELIKQANGSRHVIFHDKVKKNKVSGYIKKCDAMYIGWRDVKLYRFGVSANKYPDYMLAEKPIISAGNIGNDPVKLSNSGVCIKPEDRNELIQAIKTLYTMPVEERAVLGKNGKEYAISTLDMDAISSRFHSIFQKLISG